MIHYLTGDATRPQTPGPKIIAHVCNDFGGWGAGFVLALSARWKEPEARYRAASPKCLGLVQFIRVAPDLEVANMLAQHGGSVDYDALEWTLENAARYARQTGASLHMPRIGCGLGGGDWDRVEAILGSTCEGLEVFVYDLPDMRLPAWDDEYAAFDADGVRCKP